MAEPNMKRRTGGTLRMKWLGEFYHRFDEVVGLVLLFFLALVTVAAVLRLGRGIYGMILSRMFETIDYSAFQTVFGMVLTTFILLELLHAIVFQFIRKHEPPLLLRSFLLIALLALARKILLTEINSDLLIALSIAILSLSVSIWILGRSVWITEHQGSDHTPSGHS